MREQWRHYAIVAAYIALWMGFSLAGLWILTLLRQVFMIFFALVGIGPKVILALDRFGLVGLGLVWIASVGVLESYLRSGLNQHRLGHHLARIVLVYAGVVGIYYLAKALPGLFLG